MQKAKRDDGIIAAEKDIYRGCTFPQIFTYTFYCALALCRIYMQYYIQIEEQTSLLRKDKTLEVSRENTLFKR